MSTSRDERRPRRYVKNHNFDMPYCPATTSAGNPCPQKCSVVTIDGKRYKLKSCVMHAPIPIRKKLGVFEPVGRGSKRKFTVLELMRKRVDEEAERYLQPFEDAITALKAVVVGNGGSAHIEYTPDIALQLKAANDILDRIHGRPKTTTEVTVNDKDSTAARVPNDDERKKAMAGILQQVGALNVMTIPENASAKEPSTN